MSLRGRTNRTQEQAVADQIDCDLDNMVRRCLAQAGRAKAAGGIKGEAHWKKIARYIDACRGAVRERMHEQDRALTQ